MQHMQCLKVFSALQPELHYNALFRTWIQMQGKWIM